MDIVQETLDHGGGLDAACRHWGGGRADWCDLSTGINPVPYPTGPVPPDAWQALPDTDAFAGLEAAARRFWHVPPSARVLAVPGASAAIAAIPGLLTSGSVAIPEPTYNEHGAAFRRHGWTLTADSGEARVVVHPNNPDGRLWRDLAPAGRLTVIDESFCDTLPDQSLMPLADRPGVVVLKSFGKFWGLAGLRLGFAIGDPALVAALGAGLGTWQVSGPALAIGTAALSDPGWAAGTRADLARASARLDALAAERGLNLVGGTSLFRLFEVEDARAVHDRLCRAQILTRVFPYSDRWIRIGLPPPGDWTRLEAAL